MNLRDIIYWFLDIPEPDSGPRTTVWRSDDSISEFVGNRSYVVVAWKEYPDGSGAMTESKCSEDWDEDKEVEFMTRYWVGRYKQRARLRGELDDIAVSFTNQKRAERVKTKKSLPQGSKSIKKDLPETP